MARVVVTGGAGFLGSHLCRALLARGDQVVAIDNLITGSVRNIESLFGQRGFTFVEHDVSEYVWVPGQVDVIMHFASPASPIDFERIPIQILKVGGLGTHNCLGLAKAKDATFFLASTSEVYGDPLVHPQPESYWGNVNPVGIRGVYDEAKRYAEAMTMAYHRHHDLDVRIVRIFNSVLADEQVLYDDGVELRRETIGALAERVGTSADLDGFSVPSFDATGAMAARPASALVGHPPDGPCYEVRTRYGRSIRVTGDHSLFVEGEAGRPVPRPVTALAIGDRVAIAGRISVVERDRPVIDLVAALRSHVGADDVVVGWPGLGDVLWRRREELLDALAKRSPGRDRRSSLWPLIVRARDNDRAPLADLDALGITVPSSARVARRGCAWKASLPAVIPVTDELLWLLGLWVAEGSMHRSPGNAFLTWSGEEELLERAAKVLVRDVDRHVITAAASPERSAGLFVHGATVVALWEHLGFDANRKRIPGWVLGLPLPRLKWFVEGYREGDGVHSGIKFDAAERHEFSTVSDELKDDLVVAFGRFGLVPSVGRYESTFRQRTGDRRYPFWRLTLAQVAPWSPLDWDRGVTQQLNARRTGDIVWASVQSIDRVEPTALVYDFCVPGTENFLAGTGVMAHNTYGPRMRVDDGRAVSNFLVQALRNEPITVFGDGSQTRSFCYVDDEVRGFLALLDRGHQEPVNIGNPAEFTIAELARLAIDVTGSTSEIVHRPLPADDPTQRRPDLTVARRLLGWSPEIELADGLARAAEYFRAELAR